MGENVVEEPDLLSGNISTRNQVVEVVGNTDSVSRQLAPVFESNHGSPTVKPRQYQTEMLEESISRNIIVTADTGSGKTHIAVMRMLHELETIGERRIWFLANTVALCCQQFEYIQSQISFVQVKLILGADNVDLWSEQRIWNDALKNIKIVVCTYQILLDGLTHGFVKMSSISLLVLDEGKSAGSKIMNNFYHPDKNKEKHVPNILGLTASPVMRASAGSLTKIEETLDAICRTPTKHRSELRKQVKLPRLIQIYYQSMSPAEGSMSCPRAVKTLNAAFAGLKFEADPYILELKKDGREKSLRKLEKLMLNRKTWCQTQMKSFQATSLRIWEEMGSWAATFYITTVITKFREFVDRDEEWGVNDCSSLERKYLAESFEKAETDSSIEEDIAQGMVVSDKVTKIIDVLLQEPSDLSAIIFVQERAMVAVLYHLLTLHPKMRSRLRIGTMVGSSFSTNKSRHISELVDGSPEKDTLLQFRLREINVLIATSVLEEGIDVPACSLVLCVQKPANLKSFVQRRGRARHRDSKLVLMLDSEAETKTSDWVQLEANMKAMYEDEMRSLSKLLIDEDSEETDKSIEYVVETFDARLDLDNAVAHLHHFCNLLPADPYVDRRPEFIFSKVVSHGTKDLLRAKVNLPISVHEAVRSAESRRLWLSEKNAMKDSAFEAYVALHKAGLVNDHLLPILEPDADAEELGTAMEVRASIKVVDEQLNVWVDIAHHWEICKSFQHYSVSLDDLKMSMFLPTVLPPLKPFSVYWSSNSEKVITIDSPSSMSDLSTLTNLHETNFILQAAFSHRFRIREEEVPIVLFAADKSLKSFSGCRPASATAFDNGSCGLVREPKQDNIAYVFREWLTTKPPKSMVQNPYENYDDGFNDAAHVSVTRLPKRVDFLHKVQKLKKPHSTKAHSVVLPAHLCTVDNLDFKYVQFGLMIPSIMRRLEVYMLASLLSTTILKTVQIQNIDLIVTAISASSANEQSNYQCLEFIGDSVLKLCTSIQLTAEYPLWHEGYLSFKKDRLVSNARLSRAADESGLDKFIITKPFTGHKWRPLYTKDLLQEPTARKREMSSKVLADVVEALLGAALLDGGIEKVLACLRVFLPELDWQPLQARQLSLYKRALEIELPMTLEPLERLIGYTFKKKALLVEAVSHASCITGSASLERFEFLGDSILDSLVVDVLRTHERELSHIEMHHLRTAMVNADFLAFLCMEWAVEQERVVDPLTGERTIKRLPLWGFMRHNSSKMGSVRVKTMERHTELRDEINQAIQSGTHYPWALLARLEAMKFYSDMVESLIGAIWIDSGSFETCKSFIHSLGILPYLNRLLTLPPLATHHPKERLGVLAVDRTVRYRLSWRKRSGGGGGGREWLCEVQVGNAWILGVRDGVSEVEVQTRAAEMAVEGFVREEGEAEGEGEDEEEEGGVRLDVVMRLE